MSISRSLVVEGRGRMALRNLLLPKIPNDYILVKTKAGKQVKPSWSQRSI